MDCRGARLRVALLGDPLQVGLVVLLLLLEPRRPVARGLLVLTDR